MLLATFLDIVQHWRGVFPQQRTARRAIRQALGLLTCLGRRTLSRVIWTNGDQHRSWGADYLLHSRCPWEPQQFVRADSGEGAGVLPRPLGGGGGG